MTADDATLVLLQAYHDGELSPGETLAMERRLAAEPELRARLAELAALSGRVREVLAAPAVPATLRARVVERVGFADPPSARPAWQPLAAALLIGLLTGGAIASGIGLAWRTPGADRTADAILAGHLRGLAAPLPFDIASSNRHVVKPWFNGRTPIAPQAPDLADRGFPLEGGRIDIVDGRPVPTLVYGHDKHVISVTIVPLTAAPADGEEHRGGTTIERWSDRDLSYWAVSDLDDAQLRVFVEQFRAAVASDR